MMVCWRYVEIELNSRDEKWWPVDIWNDGDGGDGGGGGGGGRGRGTVQ